MEIADRRRERIARFWRQRTCVTQTRLPAILQAGFAVAFSKSKFKMKLQKEKGIQQSFNV